MLVRYKQVGGKGACSACVAFTLAEVLIATVIVALFTGGIISGYVQANRIAEWASMSQAAQSLAQQGMEQARAAQWNSQMWPVTNGPGTGDELTVSNYAGATWSTNYSGTNYAMDVPASGSPFYATNYITLTTVQVNPPLRMIRSDCAWKFPSTGIIFTNTVVTYRAPDQ
jgi:type II secretory pathway pseudopilin PulG